MTYDKTQLSHIFPLWALLLLLQIINVHVTCSLNAWIVLNIELGWNQTKKQNSWRVDSTQWDVFVHTWRSSRNRLVFLYERAFFFACFQVQLFSCGLCSRIALIGFSTMLLKVLSILWINNWCSMASMVRHGWGKRGRERYRWGKRVKSWGRHR